MNYVEDRMIGRIDGRMRRERQKVFEAAERRQSLERHPELPLGATLTEMPAFRPTRVFIPPKREAQTKAFETFSTGTPEAELMLAIREIREEQADGGDELDIGIAGAVQRVSSRRATGADRNDDRLRYYRPEKGKGAFRARKHFMRHPNRRLAARA